MTTPSILIVEDETPQLELLKLRAERAGFQRIFPCLKENDAVAAWDANGGYGALLLDLNLGTSENEGYRLLRHLRLHRISPERVFIRSAYLKGKTFPLEAVALHRITFYLKDDEQHELQLDADLKAFVAGSSADKRIPVS